MVAKDQSFVEVCLSVLLADFVQWPLQPVDKQLFHTWPEWVVVEDVLQDVWWLELRAITKWRAFLCINSLT